MSNVKISLGVLQRVSEFLADLPEDQLADLADGRARLAYVPVGSNEPAEVSRSTRSRAASPRPVFSPSPATVEVLDRFEVLRSREEAVAIVGPMKKPALVDIAKTLSVPGITKLTMDELRSQIVEATVGRRVDSIAIRGFDGLRP